jgi:hypothetical protein
MKALKKASRQAEQAAAASVVLQRLLAHVEADRAERHKVDSLQALLDLA